MKVREYSVKNTGKIVISLVGKQLREEVEQSDPEWWHVYRPYIYIYIYIYNIQHIL
jgi:hypothetical protein